MLKILTSAVLLSALFTGTLAAQNDSSDFSKTRIWVGINAGDVIVKDPSITPSVVVNWNFKDNRNVRFQLGFSSQSGSGDLTAETNAPSSSFRLDTTFISNPYNNSTFNLSLGYIQSAYLGRKFSFYYGLDFQFRKMGSLTQREFHVEQDFGSGQKSFIDVSEKKKSFTTIYGAAPLAGIQLDVSHNIRIALETQAVYQLWQTTEYGHFIMKQSSSFNPTEFVQENTRKQTNSDQISKLFPIAGLYFYIRI
ncbi:MAG: hypothetical protein GC181_16070 [Bacteroidetes bacterium]|nr:hypothetical protein [Bacteroidota bacterium]